VRRTRLDDALVSRGLYETRSRARDAILRGAVYVDGAAAAKPAQAVADDAAITLDDPAKRYVSRAALKLIHGLGHFRLSPAGMACLDVGASTGGFTQVLLERGARHVTAIDVGHGQMRGSLREDARVRCIEGLNGRDLARAHLACAPGFITCDVSFISMTLALAPALGLAAPGAALVALIKPQFEAGREALDGAGIVHEPAIHRAVCGRIADWLACQGWRVLGVTPSPVKGGDGNREFLIAAINAS
jgi:23S rRNA (cytidine1920-2'-O)/16S rRNA (cytidine1409-2'-O)-methyltransferase